MFTRVADHVRHQTALRLLPFLFLLYVVNYLDRTSVAYAAIGMARELGFSDKVFGLGAGIFFVSYVALQIPGALLVERWSARRMISATMIAWGTLTALTALVHTPTQLYIARFVLGAAEAGFFPGVIVYLSHWFIQEDRAKATSNFMAAIPLSFMIGSPVAGWILGRMWFDIQGWRWLFILEGMPAVLLGIVAFFVLSDWPGEAAWLSVDQKRWLQETLLEEKASNGKVITAGRGMLSRGVLLLGAVAFLDYLMAYTFVFWLPTVLKRQSGLSDLRVGLLGAIPYIVGFASMLINGWHSDRHCERHWHSAVALFTSAAGLGCFVAFPGSTSLSIVWFSMACLFVAFLPPFWAIPTEILSDSAAAVAVGMINGIASIAGFAGPYAFGYLHSRTGSFTLGFTLLAISGFLAGVLILCTPRRQRVSP